MRVVDGEVDELGCILERLCGSVGSGVFVRVL